MSQPPYAPNGPNGPKWPFWALQGPIQAQNPCFGPFGALLDPFLDPLFEPSGPLSLLQPVNSGPGPLRRGPKRGPKWPFWGHFGTPFGTPFWALRATFPLYSGIDLARPVQKGVQKGSKSATFGPILGSLPGALLGHFPLNNRRKPGQNRQEGLKRGPK